MLTPDSSRTTGVCCLGHGVTTNLDASKCGASTRKACRTTNTADSDNGLLGFFFSFSACHRPRLGLYSGPCYKKTERMRGSVNDQLTMALVPKQKLTKRLGANLHRALISTTGPRSLPVASSLFGS